MNETFECEWRAHRHGAAEARLEGEAPRRDAAFDGDVAPGDIRIFADTNRPFVALILEERGLAGWRIVPVSPFSAPASPRETVSGGRVFQLWNACTASRRFAARSWLVAKLSADESASLAVAVEAANPGRVTAGDGILARYEREFLVSGGNFIPLTVPRRATRERSLFAGGWKAAASIAIGAVALYAVLWSGRERIRRACREAWHPVSIAAEDEPVELAGELAADETDGRLQTAAEAAGAEAGAIVVAAETPETPLPRQFVRPGDGRTLADAALAGRLPAARLKMAGDGYFTDTLSVPRSILSLGSEKAVMSVAGDAYGSVPSEACSSVDGPKVECLAAVCPWNVRSILLNVRGEVADCAEVEVIFDSGTVGCWRLVAGGGTRPINAFYEARPRGDDAPPPREFCQVAVKWRAASGERRRIVPVREADIAEMEGVPERLVPVHATPAEPSNDDVGVDALL